MSQRVVQYQAVIQMAQMAPDIYDLPQLHRRMLEVLGVKNADKILPLPEDMKPKDPVTENMQILKSEPVKAFLFQDHESHIKVHMAMIQDPTVQQLIGQNPKAPQMQAALMAHIADHVGYAYRHKIEQQLGMPLPPEDEHLPPQIELALSGMMAQAANQVLQASQQQAAQQQAQQQQQDPVVQMQQKQLEIDQAKVDVARQKVQGDQSLAQQKLQVEAAAKADRLKLDEQKLAVQAATTRDKLDADQQRDGTRMGIEIAKAHHQSNKPTKGKVEK
jgi:hypothetical protein